MENIKATFTPLIESKGTKNFSTIFINAMDADPTDIPNPEEFIACEQDECRRKNLERLYRAEYAAFEYDFMKRNMHLLSPDAIAKGLEVMGGTEIPFNVLKDMKDECEKNE